MFSRAEVKEIVISFVAISIIFAYPDFLWDPQIALIYMLVLGVAFIGHELSHKFTAIHLGFWSEYRMWKEGIILALVFAIATGGAMVFAAPGAVYFATRSMFHRPTRRDVGLIGLAGPLFNAAAFAVSFALYTLTAFGPLRFLMFANAFLGLFNMLPFGPLDGRKILSWNGKVWAGLFAALIIMIIISPS